MSMKRMKNNNKNKILHADYSAANIPMNQNDVSSYLVDRILFSCEDILNCLSRIRYISFSIA